MKVPHTPPGAFTFSRKDWKKVIYCYKYVVQPGSIGVGDPFYVQDNMGPAWNRTFRKGAAWIVLNTLISSSKLTEKRRENLINIQSKIYRGV